MKGRLARTVAAVGVACCAFALSAAPGGATPAPQLLAAYQPVLKLHPAEAFEPTKVQSFISDSDLEQLTGGTWTVVDSSPEPGDLPDSGAWRLNQDTCSPATALGGLACYAAAGATGSGGPAVYGRVVPEGDRIVLQYWYFYYDDVYSYPFATLGAFWQAHEGDWEVVNVVLSGDEEPLFVGYSQHCLGQRRAWSGVDLADGTHPIVYVALGSHANYFTPGLHQFNPVCVPAQVTAILNAFHLPPPADVVSGDGPAVDGTIHQIEAGHPAWMSFPGFWGELQYFHAPAPIGTVPFGTAPQGPAFHSVWTDPLATLAGWPAG
jgi:hypothetical protein